MAKERTSGYVVGYTTCERLFFPTPDSDEESVIDPTKVVNPFSDETEEWRGFEEAYYDFTQK